MSLLYSNDMHYSTALVDTVQQGDAVQGQRRTSEWPPGKTGTLGNSPTSWPLCSMRALWSAVRTSAAFPRGSARWRHLAASNSPSAISSFQSSRKLVPTNDLHFETQDSAHPIQNSTGSHSCMHFTQNPEQHTFDAVQYATGPILIVYTTVRATKSEPYPACYFTLSSSEFSTMNPRRYL